MYYTILPRDLRETAAERWSSLKRLRFVCAMTCPTLQNATHCMHVAFKTQFTISVTQACIDFPSQGNAAARHHHLQLRHKRVSAGTTLERGCRHWRKSQQQVHASPETLVKSCHAEKFLAHSLWGTHQGHVAGVHPRPDRDGFRDVSSVHRNTKTCCLEVEGN